MLNGISFLLFCPALSTTYLSHIILAHQIIPLTIDLFTAPQHLNTPRSIQATSPITTAQSNKPRSNPNIGILILKTLPKRRKAPSCLPRIPGQTRQTDKRHAMVGGNQPRLLRTWPATLRQCALCHTNTDTVPSLFFHGAHGLGAWVGTPAPSNLCVCVCIACGGCECERDIQIYGTEKWYTQHAYVVHSKDKKSTAFYQQHITYTLHSQL